MTPAVDGAQVILARGHGAAGVDELEVGRDQLAGGRSVRVDQRLKAGLSRSRAGGRPPRSHPRFR